MNARTQTTIIGLLLAGGLSRRMGGGDKGLKDLSGRTMLARVVERLRPQVAGLILNANGDPGRFAELGLPVVADPIEGFVGPLAGILAGLLWARTHAPEARYVASVSTDAPFLPLDLVPRLETALSDRPNAIAIAQSAGELHPVIGLWPVAHAEDLAAELKSGVRKVLRWTDRHGTVPVDFPFLRIGDRMVDPFFNANTPEELAEAAALIAAAEARP